MKPQIPISEASMKKTLQVCSTELQHTLQKEVSHFSLLKGIWEKNTLKIILIAVLGFILLSFCAFHYPEQRMVLYSVYFGFLGFINLYEILQQKLYHMMELVHVCRMNHAKLFLYKSMLCTLFDIGIVVFLYGMETSFDQHYNILLLSTLVPLLVAQIAAIAFDLFLKNSFTTLLFFMAAYSLYEIIYLRFGKFITEALSANILYKTTCLLLLLYFFLIFFCYRRGKKEVFSWN